MIEYSDVIVDLHMIYNLFNEKFGFLNFIAYI
jgi:hypothetical protein